MVMRMIKLSVLYNVPCARPHMSMRSTPKPTTSIKISELQGIIKANNESQLSHAQMAVILQQNGYTVTRTR